MFLKQIYDESLSQYAYLIGCQRTGESVVIDPQRDIDRYLKIAKKNDLRITAVAETHIHADYLSGVREFIETEPNTVAYLSDEGDSDWKYEWAKGNDQVTLLKNGDTFKVGNIQFSVVHTPGHTPEHICFLIEDQGGGADEPMGFVTGDFIFVGDVGRPDLLESAAGIVGIQEPSARALYSSIVEFAKMPDYLQVLPGHGAGSACGKALGAIPMTTVGYEKRFNGAVTKALNEGEEAFVVAILSGQPEPPVYFARMKKVNKLGAPILNGLPTPQKLSVKDFIEQGCSGGSVILDSTRDRVSFMDRHLRGALLAPLGDKYSVVAGSYVTPEEKVYLLLNDESDLDEAVRTLVRIGLDNILGYALWEEVKGSPVFSEYEASTERCQTSEIEAVRTANPTSEVIDVRSVGEFNEGHVPNAKNIAHTRVANHMDSLKGKKLIVHCGSGLRAALSVPHLERNGMEVIYVDGLFKDYQLRPSSPEGGE